jgi:hypothetical protein
LGSSAIESRSPRAPADCGPKRRDVRFLEKRQSRRRPALHSQEHAIPEASLDRNAIVVYKLRMFELKQTEAFRRWRWRLKDHRARATIASRLDRDWIG